MLNTRTTRIPLLLCLMLAFALSPSFANAPKREFYQLRIYHLKSDSQKQRLETYLKQAFMPALHRAGVDKVGVFSPAVDAVATEAIDSLLYVLIPFKSTEQFMNLPERLAKDKAYTTAGQDYLYADYANPVYSRFESVLMEAFAGMPSLMPPKLQAPPAERIYELRNYEAATEGLHESKISQFNNGELDIFKRLGFNVVFTGQVKAGTKMPSLMYMTSFESKAERDAHWKAFGTDPGWKSLNAKPEYAHNFLRADIYLLHPTAYSEI